MLSIKRKHARQPWIAGNNIGGEFIRHKINFGKRKTIVQILNNRRRKQDISDGAKFDYQNPVDIF